jgi:hypothetical protein
MSETSHKIKGRVKEAADPLIDIEKPSSSQILS